MEYDLPYLPDILRGVVSRVDEVFSDAIRVDRFNVFFDSGVYSQVAKNIYKQDASDTYPLVWLVMNFVEDRGRDYSVYADVSCQVIIAMPTKKDYTQLERDELIFKPRLIPIYAEFMRQLSVDSWLQTPLINRIQHQRILRPYWGGADVNGPDTKNLFDSFIDAISINNLQIKIKNNCLIEKGQTFLKLN